jgi:hypothetical protein
MFVPHNDGEALPNFIGKKQFWWCTNHNKRCRHTTNKCKGFNVGKGRPSKTNDSSQATTTSKSNKKKQKIVQALGAASQDEDDEETKRAFQALREQSLQLAVYGIALTIVLVYVSFYANDGRKYMSYVLKSRRLK